MEILINAEGIDCMKHRLSKFTAFLMASLISLSALCSINVGAEPDIQVSEEIVISENTGSIPDNDELLLGYFEQQLFDEESVSNYVATSVLGPSKLSGDALNVYKTLKSKIADIAAGKVGSTEFTLPDVTFTYEQLGLTSGCSNSDISAALSDINGKIYDYLLYDIPYEFYWHDKTVGFRYGCSYARGSTGITCTSYSYKFTPGVEYAGSSDYTVDTAKTKAASAAAENAAAIVTENSGKGNVAKLTAYKEKICELVTYDDAAVDSNPSKIGIDPWQVIHVFDGDKSTNVVCEGYSKAFYYLCQLSDFSGYIDCKIVSGFMNGGAHMWNIVSIGSKNYLVDVTNCDDGSIGSPDNLFLKGVNGSVVGGYARTIRSKNIVFTYRDEMVSMMGKNILTLSDTDYSAATDDSATYTGTLEDEDNEDEKPSFDDDDEGVVVWANGSKNFKSFQLTPKITPTNWYNSKGKTQKGKLVWTAMLSGTPEYDVAKHKVTTKSDKTVVTVSSKGKLAAKAGGTAYIYATDTGTLEYEAFKVTVKNAPTALYLFDDPEKTANDKKEKLKSVNVIAGGKSSRVYIAPFVKKGEVSEDCTYTVTAKKNDGGIISFTDVKKDSDGNIYFDVTGNKLLKAGKTAKISVTVMCEQSGKKTSVNVQVYSPVKTAKCTAQSSSPEISEKGDTITLDTTLTINGTSDSTTDKLQAVVATAEPVVNSTGKKATVVKSKEVTVKMDKSTFNLTLKASKPVTQAAGVYFIATDAVTKLVTVHKVADIAADGKITLT